MYSIIMQLSVNAFHLYEFLLELFVLLSLKEYNIVISVNANSYDRDISQAHMFQLCGYTIPYSRPDDSISHWVTLKSNTIPWTIGQ